MTSESVFAHLPSEVIESVAKELQTTRSKVAKRIFNCMTPLTGTFPYKSTMELALEIDSLCFGQAVKKHLNPILAAHGYYMAALRPELPIIDSHGEKSRQRYWGFVKHG